MQSEWVQIRSLGSSGEGVGKLEDGLTLFVEGGLPGERIRVEVRERKSNYAKGDPIEWGERSPERVEAPCPVYGKCGGCQLMHLSYVGQLVAKRQRVVDALERIGGLQGVHVEECLGAESPWAYRHKIQLPVGPGNRLGLYEKGSHRLVQVEGCLIHCPEGERLVRSVQELLLQLPEGLVRYVIVRSTTLGEQLLILVVREVGPLRDLIPAWTKAQPQLKGVVACINQRPDNRILTGEWLQLAGEGHIHEEVAGLKFRISAGSFFQVYPAQAERMVRLVEEWVGAGAGRKALDGCCGVGLMSLVLARLGWDVLGLEVAPEAVADAQANARLNQLQAQFECRAVGRLEADLVLLNPPRGGIEPQVLAGLVADQILYISCDPATLARDIRRLQGYEVERIQPVDLFPQTAHVETVALLRRVK
jgi:23S rRNA (uracil1939-C5)-methyltransferase